MMNWPQYDAYRRELTLLTKRLDREGWWQPNEAAVRRGKIDFHPALLAVATRVHILAAKARRHTRQQARRIRPAAGSQ